MAEFREVNGSDLHVPHHDPYAWELFCRIVEAIRPTSINLLGDMLNCEMLGPFEKDPERYKDGGLQEDLDQWFRLANHLQRIKPEGCNTRLIPGNHEDWLRRYVWRHPELYGLRALDLASLMRLNELGIQFYPEEIEIIPNVLVGKHGTVVRQNSAYSARGELEKESYSISTITGHTHRLGAYYRRTRRGVVTARENGCLCSLKSREWVKRPDWHQGITVVLHWGKEAFHVEEVPFLGQGKKMKAIVLGQEVRL